LKVRVGGRFRRTLPTKLTSMGERESPKAVNTARCNSARVGGGC
jgi:hypothetical protein